MIRWSVAMLGVCALVHTPSASSSAAARTVTIHIRDFAFAPRDTTVAVGDTVVWQNDDAFIHVSKADSGAWSSADLPRGGRFSFVAARSGRFEYHCAAHPVMKGSITVIPSK